MDVLVPMMLYDTNGNGQTVYVPSKLGGQNPQPTQPAALLAPMPPTGVPFPASAPPPDYQTPPPPPPPPSCPPPVRAQRASPEGTLLYITNMPPCMTPDKLHRLLSTYGTVVSCRIMKKAELGNRVIGYVSYQDPDMARLGLASLDGITVDGWRLSVSVMEPEFDPSAPSPSSNLYISSLPADCVDAGLRAVFSPYGHIVSLVVFKEMRTGLCKGSGMVRFSTSAEAAAAIQALHHQVLPGMDRPLEVRYAENKVERALRCGQQRAQECNTSSCAPELDVTVGNHPSRTDLMSNFQMPAGPPLHPANFAPPHRPLPAVHITSGPAHPPDPPPTQAAPLLSPREASRANMQSQGAPPPFLWDLAAKVVNETGIPTQGSDRSASYSANTVWQPIGQFSPKPPSDSLEKSLLPAPPLNAYPELPQPQWASQWAGAYPDQSRR